MASRATSCNATVTARQSANLSLSGLGSVTGTTGLGSVTGTLNNVTGSLSGGNSTNTSGQGH